MKNRMLANALILCVLLLVIANCQNATSPVVNIQESFNVIQDVTAISGAEGAVINLQDKADKEAYYSVDFNNIQSSKVVTDSTMEAWCIEWGVSAVTGQQEDINLYSTNGREGWQKLNYFLTNKDQFTSQDSELSWKEIQVVIWSLVDFKPFDVDEMHTYEELDDGFYENGEYQFNVQKVKEIVSYINNDLSSDNSKWYFEVFAIIIENEGQTLIVEGYWNQNQIPFPF